MRGRPLVVVLALLTLLTGCSSLEGTGDKGYISQDGSVLTIAPSERADPIDVTGTDLDGGEVSLADLRGGVVVVNVWGSWCAPCVAEQPDLVEAAEQIDDRAEFLGINIRDASQDNARAFVRSFDVSYPSIYDPDSKTLLAFSEVVPVRSPPTTFVLDDQGRIAAAVFGQLPSVQTLVDLVDDVTGDAGG